MGWFSARAGVSAALAISWCACGSDEKIAGSTGSPAKLDAGGDARFEASHGGHVADGGPGADVDPAARRCYPVGARCDGPRYDCVCTASHTWDCSGPLSIAAAPPQSPFDFFGGCLQTGMSCTRFGPCEPRCTCRDLAWQCDFLEECRVPTCPIIAPASGTDCADRLGQVCAYQAGNGGVATCACEPTSPSSPAEWTCRVDV